MDAQIILIKTFMGRELVRGACGMKWEKVLITSSNGLRRMKGGDEIFPILFPLESVFRFEENVPD